MKQNGTRRCTCKPFSNISLYRQNMLGSLATYYNFSKYSQTADYSQTCLFILDSGNISWMLGMLQLLSCTLMQRSLRGAISYSQAPALQGPEKQTWVSASCQASYSVLFPSSSCSAALLFPAQAFAGASPFGTSPSQTTCYPVYFIFQPAYSQGHDFSQKRVQYKQHAQYLIYSQTSTKALLHFWEVYTEFFGSPEQGISRIEGHPLRSKQRTKLRVRLQTPAIRCLQPGIYGYSQYGMKITVEKNALILVKSEVNFRLRIFSGNEYPA